MFLVTLTFQKWSGSKVTVPKNIYDLINFLCLVGSINHIRGKINFSRHQMRCLYFI